MRYVMGFVSLLLGLLSFVNITGSGDKIHWIVLPLGLIVAVVFWSNLLPKVRVHLIWGMIVLTTWHKTYDWGRYEEWRGDAFKQQLFDAAKRQNQP